MYSTHELKRFKARVLILIVCGFLAAIVEWIVINRKSAKDANAGPAFNRVRVMMIKSALDQFHAAFNRWPTNLSELKTNSQGVLFFDGQFEDFYKRPFVYESPAKGVPGRIGSFGADGRVGGSNANVDCFVPLAALE